MSTPSGRPERPKIPDKLQEESEAEHGASNLLVRAGGLAQLALLLPAAVVVGWGIGLALDHWLNQHWISVAGLLLGAVAGFVQIFRIVLSLNKE